MATLEKIRQRSGLVIALIGVAIAAFTLTDLLGSGQSVFGGNDDTVMEVNGEKINRVQFSQKLSERTEQYKQQMRDPNLNNVTTKQLVDATYDEILRSEILKMYSDQGFSVTEEELYFRIINNPNIQQNQSFVDPNTGRFSEDLFKRGLAGLRDNKDLSEEASTNWASWVAFEDAVRDQTLQSKVYEAARKGIYMPSKLEAYKYNLDNTTRNVSYVFLPYTDVDDSEVEITDGDIKSYVAKNKETFKQEESRDFQFANFPIQPSVEDYEEVRDQLADLIDDRAVRNPRSKLMDTLVGFKTTSSDSSFVNANSDTRFDPTMYIPGELPVEIDSVMSQAQEGDVYGPYRSEGGFKVTKLSQVRPLADSVEVKHILISFQGATRASQAVVRTYPEARALADSLNEILVSDVSQWDSINAKFNDDVVAQGKGGDLGWIARDAQFDQMFKDYIFRNKKGHVGNTFTQFGIHLIQVVNTKGANRGMKVATVYREVTPSEKTFNDIYNRASLFAAEAQNSDDYVALADSMGVGLLVANNVKEFDENIVGLGNNRDVVRWTFNEERAVGDIQLLNNNQRSYVVVILNGINAEGLQGVEKARVIATPEIMKEKKAAILKKRIAEANASDVIALGTAVKTKQIDGSVSLGSNNLGAVGQEPLVLGAIAGLEENQMSSPIAGERGVFVVSMTSKTVPTASPDQTAVAQQKAAQTVNRVISDFVPSLVDKAGVVDRRPVFY